LTQANQNGQVGLRFTALQMPDGGTENIEGSGVTLDLRSPKRNRQRAKSGEAGVGSISDWRGFDGDVSCRRLRIRRSHGSRRPEHPSAGAHRFQYRAGGRAGVEWDFAYNQNIVVTLPGNIRFYIVLQDAAIAKQSDLAPAAGPAARTNIASAGGQALPTRRNCANSFH